MPPVEDDPGAGGGKRKEGTESKPISGSRANRSIGCSDRVTIDEIDDLDWEGFTIDVWEDAGGKIDVTNEWKATPDGEGVRN